ncbi:MAG: YwbE family protein [Bacteroidetes bacterium]|nr:YwbE family protein [Bacteroidota bacterium]
MLDGNLRKNIQIGIEVEVVQKQDQSSGKLTSGVVKKILTNSPNHPHGIKVMLESGIVGRVKTILE